MILNMHLGLRISQMFMAVFLYLFCARPCNDDLGMCEILSLPFQGNSSVNVSVHGMCTRYQGGREKERPCNQTEKAVLLASVTKTS